MKKNKNSSTKLALAVAIATVAASSSTAFAVSTCDTMPTKQQRSDCWSNIMSSEMEQAEEYEIAVFGTRRVPEAVKQQVRTKRENIALDADRQCPKASGGYPDTACYIDHIQKFKDFTYQKTSKYGVPDMRLN
ncbi:hypothetical protein ACFSHT_10260 [Paraburkholderia silviterrae]|uniref:Uncharacterized protein n=1 Tax=Paraburkholderia silviterrae TaxID=2528715 RepID=A0A4R5MDZ6_9BURK|nr:hypothetical protein [Paraburkholderia silviterrae]TDG25338.1 hypothetical protein EYW47_05735 [Paraburkholderia silviterrae]